MAEDAEKDCRQTALAATALIPRFQDIGNLRSLGTDDWTYINLLNPAGTF